MPPLLPNATIHEIFIAATTMDLSWETLRMSLHSGYARTLPTATEPGAQILSDLLRMNQIEHLDDGSVPLRDWVATAILLGGPRVEVATLRDVLVRLDQGRREAFTQANNAGPVVDPVKAEALRSLLASMFESGELRRLVARLPEGGRMSAELPGNTVSLAELSDHVTRLLFRYGLVDGALFDVLKSERPRREKEILSVRAQLVS